MTSGLTLRPRHLGCHFMILLRRPSPSPTVPVAAGFAGKIPCPPRQSVVRCAFTDEL